MKKAILYILFTSSIISGNTAEMISTPIISPSPVKSPALTQEIELLNIFKKESISEREMERNPNLKDIEKMQAIIGKFLQRKDLDAMFALQLIPSYMSITLMTSKSPKDLDALSDEINHLFLTNPEIDESLKVGTKNYFAQGSEAVFTQTQALRDEFNRKLTPTTITTSAERKAKLMKEYDEIRDKIRKNRAVISIEHPKKEQFIRRRDTLEPFLKRKDLEPETILMLLREYNQSAIPAAKTPADIEESKKMLE